jgi:histone-lysine N-methyltransferase SETMAR
MDQRTIVAYLVLKGLSARSIHQDLVARSWGDAMAYSTVARYIHDAHCSPSSQTAAPIAVPSGLDDSDEAILSVLDENPFASVRQLSRLTHIPATTVYPRLTESLGFTARHLGWVPHALSEEQMAQRVELSRELLRILQVQHDRAWHYIVTLDELWLYLSTDHELIWLPHGEKVPERERHTVQSKKFMPTIVWNPRQFHLMNVLPKGCKFNSSHYITEILSPLSEWRSADAHGRTRKLIVHADNARPHVFRQTIDYLERNGMKRALHPPYSPDLAPSDFSLFGYVKGCLADHSFESTDALFGVVQGILEAIEKVTLQAVFLDWMERLWKCIDSNGVYVD